MFQTDLFDTDRFCNFTIHTYTHIYGYTYIFKKHLKKKNIYACIYSHAFIQVFIHINENTYAGIM